MRCRTLAAIALLSFTAPLSAQTLALNTSRSLAEPEDIEAEARSLHNSPDEYRRAAMLYLEAAILRGQRDTATMHDQRMAARLLYYVGDAAHARVIMEEAGDQALRLGDVIAAAHTFVDAAWIALQIEQVAEAVRLAERAELLMASPLVDDIARHLLLERIRRKDGVLNVLPVSP